MHDVIAIPSTLGQVLQDFCHMEWWETHELRDMIASPAISTEKRDRFAQFRCELDDAISRGYITPDQFFELTLDDCDSNAEVVERLKEIRREVFGA